MRLSKIGIIEAIIGIIGATIIILSKLSPYDIKLMILVGISFAINGIALCIMGDIFIKRIERTRISLGEDSKDKIPKNVIFFGCFTLASIIIICLVVKIPII